MKLFFISILALLVLSETIFPCCLWDDCGHEENITTHEEKKGDCSPFGACATCVQAALVSKPLMVAFSVQDVNITHTPASNHFLLSFYSRSLLQPPRLG